MRKVEVSTLKSHLFWNRDYTANKDTHKTLDRAVVSFVQKIEGKVFPSPVSSNIA